MDNEQSVAYNHESELLNEQSVACNHELKLPNEQFELTTDELSDKELEAVSGGWGRCPFRCQ